MNIDLASFNINTDQLFQKLVQTRTEIDRVKASQAQLRAEFTASNKDVASNQKSLDDLNKKLSELTKGTDSYNQTLLQRDNAEKVLNESSKQQIAVNQSYQATLTASQLELNKLNNQARSYQSVLDAQNRSTNDSITLYERQRAELSLLQKEQRELGVQLERAKASGNKESVDQLTIAYKDATEKANGLAVELRNIDTAGGNFTSNIGNYTQSIIDAYNALELQKQGLIDNKTAIESEITALNEQKATIDSTSQAYTDTDLKLKLFQNALLAIDKDIDAVTSSMQKSTNEIQNNGAVVEQVGLKQASFREQLRLARLEVIQLSEQYGASSIEATNAAIKAAELADRVSDAGTLIDAFNPDAKFKALSATLSGVAGGFGAVEGAMNLLGNESEDVQKALLRVQSAMAISQGLQDVGEAMDSFKQLGAVVKNLSVVQGVLNFVKTGSLKIQQQEVITNAAAATSQVALATATTGTAVATTGATLATKAFRIALIATGIGAIVVALGFLVANFKEVKEAVYNVIPGLKSVGDFFGKIIDTVTDFVGVTSDASRNLDKLKASADKSLQINKKYLAEHGDQIDEYTRKKIEANNAYNEAVKEDGADVVALRARANREILKADQDREKEQREKRNEESKKIADDLEKRNNEAKKKREENKKTLEDALKSELDSAQKLADEKVKLANVELNTYIEKNKSILDNEKFLTAELLKQEQERLRNIEKAKLDQEKLEFDTADKIFKDKIKAFGDESKLNQTQLNELATLKLQQKELELNYNSDVTKIKEETQKGITATETRYSNERIEAEKMRKAVQFQTEILDLEARGATEQEIKQAQLDQETQLELDKFIEKQDTKFQTKIEKDQEERDIQAEIDLVQQELEAELLAAKDENEKIRVQTQLDALTNLQKTDAKKKKQIDDAVLETKLQAYSKVFGDISGLFGKETLAAKVAGIAQAGINTYLGATQALKDPKLVAAYPLNIISAGTIIASGLQSVAKISGIQGFAEGGLISDGVSISRSNGDNRLISAKDGEVILNESQQRALGGSNIFKSIGVPGFATGGVVGSPIASLSNIQNQFTNQLNSEALTESIRTAVLEGSAIGTATGSQRGISDLTENNYISSTANF